MQGDVSNNKARNASAKDGDKRTALPDTEKQPLRRSRRVSSISYATESQNPANEDDTKVESAPVIPRNLDQKRAQASDTNPTTKNDNNVDSSSTTGEITHNDELTCGRLAKSEAAAMETKKSSNRSQKRVNEGRLEIESALLEPRPKRTRKKATKRTAKKQKTTESIAQPKKEKKVAAVSSKVQTPDAVLSVLPSSTTALTSSSHRRLDQYNSSDDDHCLPRKLEGPFDASKFTTGIATYDRASEGKVGEVPAYVTDIFQRLFDAEVSASIVGSKYVADPFETWNKVLYNRFSHQSIQIYFTFVFQRATMPSPSYMFDEQDEINSTMRAILIDWLVGVQMKFRLQPETLYLCVNIIDRYLSKSPIRRRHLQLLGITSLFVACKYEETYPLEVKDCVYVTDRAYNRQQVIDMEYEIVRILGFKMTVPTAYPFLQRFLHITNASKTIRDLASYYTERMLQEYCMLNFRSSLVACAAVYLAWNNPRVAKEPEDTGVAKVVSSFHCFLLIENTFRLLSSPHDTLQLSTTAEHDGKLYWILRETNQTCRSRNMSKNPTTE